MLRSGTAVGVTVVVGVTVDVVVGVTVDVVVGVTVDVVVEGETLTLNVEN
jgi:hypothetical protein